MQKLFGLLVAINNYPNPAHRLRGCENDRNELFSFLQQRYRDKYEFHIKTLTNTEATRDGIIEAFQWFEKAQPEDICLFFFAGHGSQMSAPQEFHHLESDRLLETLVCYDSRTENGRDLIDKELSYLIWKTVHRKDLHFVAIMDCCHSGSNTRAEPEAEILSRNVRNAKQSISVDTFLGYEEYQQSQQGWLTPPRAPHILLSAALPKETAKEVRVAGNNRGVFSYCLIEALTKATISLTYAELINRVNLRIGGLVRNQSPNLETNFAAEKDLVFLTQQSKEKQTTYYISFNDKQGWIASAGAVHGVKPSTELQQTAFQLVDSDHRFPVTEVQASFSKIQVWGGLNRKQIYEAKLIQSSNSTIQLSFAKGMPHEGQTFLQAAFQLLQPTTFTIANTDAVPDYIISVIEDKWILSLPFEAKPLFSGVGPFSQSSAEQFIKRIERIARWKQILNLRSANPTIKREEYLIQLERLSEPGDYSFSAPAETIDHRQILQLEYQEKNGVWYKPAFRAKVKNIGQRSLWFSAIYLEDDFGISNELLPSAELEVGEEKWLEIQMGRHLTNAIQVVIAKDYQAQGISTVLEYLKILISSVPIQTDSLNQKGLPQHGQMMKERALHHEPLPDGWCIETINIKINHPNL